MIDIHALTHMDQGRQVISTNRGDEVGVIRSFNQHWIYVVFDGPDAIACRPEDLEFRKYKQP